MTNSGKKRGPQTYNGLKALLLASGLGASMLGTRLIARSANVTSQEAVPTEVVEVTPEPTREFTLGELGQIPTVVPAYVVQEPTPEPTNSAPGNAPAQSQQVAAAPAASVQSAGPAIPTVVAVGALPPIPQPSSGGGGGGGGGGNGGGGGGGGGATSASS